MREIKFRYTCVRQNGHIFHAYFNLFDIQCGDAAHWIDVNIITVAELNISQFAGLKDKNKIDIYEGDIIRRSTGYIFEMRATTYGISGNTVLDKRKGCIVLGYQNDILDEVIGNIYEIPKLLTPSPIAGKEE